MVSFSRLCMLAGGAFCVAAYWQVADKTVHSMTHRHPSGEEVMFDYQIMQKGDGGMFPSPTHWVEYHHQTNRGNMVEYSTWFGVGEGVESRTQELDLGRTDLNDQERFLRETLLKMTTGDKWTIKTEDDKEEIVSLEAIMHGSKYNSIQALRARTATASVAAKPDEL